eukprot:1059708-Amphidinium_carterae.1
MKMWDISEYTAVVDGPTPSSRDDIKHKAIQSNGKNNCNTEPTTTTSASFVLGKEDMWMFRCFRAWN